MPLFHALVDGGGLWPPGPRRREGPEEQSPHLQHLHRVHWGLPWAVGLEVVRVTLI